MIECTHNAATHSAVRRCTPCPHYASEEQAARERLAPVTGPAARLTPRHNGRHRRHQVRERRPHWLRTLTARRCIAGRARQPGRHSGPRPGNSHGRTGLRHRRHAGVAGEPLSLRHAALETRPTRRRGAVYVTAPPVLYSATPAASAASIAAWICWISARPDSMSSSTATRADGPMS